MRQVDQHGGRPAGDRCRVQVHPARVQRRVRPERPQALHHGLAREAEPERRGRGRQRVGHVVLAEPRERHGDVDDGNEPVGVGPGDQDRDVAVQHGDAPPARVQRLAQGG